ncbi:hypothetical protein BU24DRAFT_143478 [Aaosphaeria arxii CBS 175.79]|uniref:Uncharacterized protein n=1 Tax=Aaosphaeria arxii CBS 175.79 TaxID=1450172 RepID=A0A6A5XUQ7_9PLEO|nr:uncharacterized protein BU24DRAFT_143478 [Aaosphaeria arxii CBS 175.79]KAF2017085.1 hypothetical protein BU24DRAFT_143478 [Aaosphaeria arxii CBS 175.79]
MRYRPVSSMALRGVLRTECQGSRWEKDTRQAHTGQVGQDGPSGKVRVRYCKTREATKLKPSTRLRTQYPQICTLLHPSSTNSYPDNLPSIHPIIHSPTPLHSTHTNPCQLPLAQTHRRANQKKKGNPSRSNRSSMMMSGPPLMICSVGWGPSPSLIVQPLQFPTAAT